MISELTPAAAKAIVHSGNEVAFLDVREAGQFGEGHPLFAIPCPYSHLETDVLALVPRRAVPVVLIDAGDGVARRAAERLRSIGYDDLSIVDGGTPAWSAAGFTLFKGVNVPSKTLGELAEHVWQPATIAPERAADLLRNGEIALFDGRPPDEYAKMHVPGAVCLPNGELAHRLPALDVDRPIVVGCAGRTRGIIGAIGLGLMGHGGPVYALENGTQGWALAGLTLERGKAAAAFPDMSGANRQASRKAATIFADRWDIPFVDAETIERFLGDTRRSTFVFDVRSSDEAEYDPIAIAAHALSGQLVQASDRYIGVRHSRVVLCDDCGVRAGLTAFWLRQMGFEPHIAIIDDELRALEPTAPATPRHVDAEAISAGQALEELRDGRACLVDLRGSRAYRASHVDGAVWSIRPRLPALAGATAKPLVLVADDDAVLNGVIADLNDLVGTPIRVVRGGHAALVEAGATIVETPSLPDDDTAIDFLRFVHDRHDGNLEASRRYLAWETGLIDQLDDDERNEYKLARPT